MALEVAERLRVLIVAGVTVGALVAGVVSRLAMLVLRLTSPDRVDGVTSDDGFTIGRFTPGGSYNLMVIGAVVGIIGAAAYRAVAPWLIGPLWFRRVTVAAASGVVVGSMLVHADGVDFTLLKPTWLAIGLFVALPAAFGASMAVVVDRIAATDSWTARRPWRWLAPVLLVVCFPPTIVFVAIAAAVLACWVPIRRPVAEAFRSSAALTFAVRAAWLAIAVAGLVALVRDVDAIM